MTREWEKTGEFEAVSEGGRKFTIEVTSEYDVGVTMGGTPYRVEVRKGLRTYEGDHVAWLSQGKYRVMLLNGWRHSDPGKPVVDLFSDDPRQPSAL